ncbi:MAG: VC0807 family protein [Sciscionella sp.]
MAKDISGTAPARNDEVGTVGHNPAPPERSSRPGRRARLLRTFAGAALSLLSGSARFLLAKVGAFTGVSGVWFLCSLRAWQPLGFHAARSMLECVVGPGGPSWDLLWERLTAFRRVWCRATVIWGVVLVADAVLRVLLAYSLPVVEVPAVTGAQWIALVVLLQVVTNVYYGRAGIFRTGSKLYEPVACSTVDNSTNTERTIG